MSDVGGAYVDIQARPAPGFEKDAEKAIASPMAGIAKKAAAVFAGAFVVKGAFDFGKDALAAAQESAKVAAQTTAVLASTGNAAGVSAEQVGKLADAIARKTGVDDEAIASAENLLLTFTNIRNGAGEQEKIFDRTTKAAVDMAAALGGDAASKAQLLGKALNDPAEGLSKLTRLGVAFTDAQKEQIKAMAAAGDAAGAQALILDEVNKKFGGSAEAQATAADKMHVAIGNAQETIGGLLIPVIEKASTVLATLAVKLSETIVWFQEHRTVAIALGVVLGTIVTALAAYAVAAQITSVYTKVAAVASKAYAAAQWLLNAALNANPISLVVIALAALAAGLVLAYQRSESFRNVVDGLGRFLRDEVLPVIIGIGEAFRDGFTAALGIVTTVVGGIQAVIEGFVGVAVAAWETFGGSITDIVGGAFGIVQAVIESFVGVAQGLIDVFIGVFTGKWGQAWDGIKEVVSSVFGAIPAILSGIFDLITGLFRLQLDAIVLAWDTAWGLLSGAPAAALDAVKTAALAVFDAIRTAAETAVNAVVGFFTDLPSNLLGLLEGISSAASSIGTAIIEGIGKGLGAVGGIVADVADAFSTALKKVVDAVVLAPLRLALNTMAHGLASVNIPGVGRAFDAASSTIENLADKLRLAQGGIVFGPTAAIVGDNPNAHIDPEVVAPLSQLRRLLKDDGRGRPTIVQVDASVIIQGPVYGVDDLDRLLEEHDRRLAQRLAMPIWR